ncbi:MAG: GspH/FimT family pseudopilin [Betaproteobacteria bacterium]|nr:GspH/FimT family pseudopilin [Betaproteobacteria bacterium]
MWILYQIRPGSQAQRGFTLLELLIALAVLVVLAGLGLPELGRLLHRQRIASAHAELQAALGYARGEAVRRAAQVSLCRRAAGSGPAACASGGRDWSHGWIVFVDRGAETGARDPVLGEILLVHEGFATHATLTFTAPRGASLTYDDQGWPDRNFVGGAFKFCSKADASLGKRLVASRLGRLRTEPLNCRG